MKDSLINYYKNISQYYSSLHNHKEVSAWAGLALHIGFCGLVIGIKAPPSLETTFEIILTIITIIVFILVLLYVRNQLAMKDRAGGLAGAALLLMTELIGKRNVNIRSYLTLVASTNTKAQSEHILPERLIREMEHLNARATGERNITRSMIYGLLILSTWSVLVIRWLSILP